MYLLYIWIIFKCNWTLIYPNNAHKSIDWAGSTIYLNHVTTHKTKQRTNYVRVTREQCDNIYTGLNSTAINIYWTLFKQVWSIYTFGEEISLVLQLTLGDRWQQTSSGRRQGRIGAQVFSQQRLKACMFGWWLMTSAGLFWEKSTAGWLLVAGLLWEKSTAGWWLISQTNRVLDCLQQHLYALLHLQIAERKATV
jgi:hypothetical protein